MICDKCGRAMKLRENKRNGSQFWGCSGYFEKPQCKNTKPYNNGYNKDMMESEKTFEGFTLFSIHCDYDHVQGSECPRCRGKFSPSDYQKNVFAAVDTWTYDTFESLAITACPGSGKTTLLSELMRYVPDPIRQKTAALSFARKNAFDFKGRFEDGVYTGTHHALLLRDYKSSEGGKLELKKKWNILKEILKNQDWEYKKKMRPHQGLIIAMIGYLRGDLLDLTKDNFESMLEKYGKSFGDEEDACYFLLSQLWEENNRLTDKGIVDFDDLLIWAYENPSKLSKYDLLLIDEYQDTNTLQREVYTNHVN